ncbi:MAG: hypothetical protein AB1726_04035 [Planctomycetota bacterium]
MCGEYTAALAVRDCASQPLMGGVLVLDYARTWVESSTPGQIDYQVWRFLAKVDLAKTTTLPSTCPIPPCLPAVPACFFHGYVDYAFHCLNGTWESAIVLYHGCDDFQHTPVFSAVPGVFHPIESFAIVAPDTAGNPFVPAFLAPAGGTAVAEAVRSVSPPAGGPCLAKDFLTAGRYLPVGQACLRPISPFPPQHTAYLMDGTGFCGNSFLDLNLWPIVPWFDVIETAIGTWTTTASYPGPETASAVEGLFRYNDACTASGALTKTYDIFYGAHTRQGYMVIPTNPLVPLTQSFVDLASNYSTLVGAPIPFPIFGAVMPTAHLISLNY